MFSTFFEYLVASGFSALLASLVYVSVTTGWAAD